MNMADLAATTPPYPRSNFSTWGARTGGATSVKPREIPKTKVDTMIKARGDTIPAPGQGDLFEFNPKGKRK